MRLHMMGWNNIIFWMKMNNCFGTNHGNRKLTKENFNGAGRRKNGAKISSDENHFNNDLI